MNYMIHMSGMYSLNKLRQAFGVQKISNMIYDTSDYLIYHLKILFRKVNIKLNSISLTSTWRAKNNSKILDIHCED